MELVAPVSAPMLARVMRWGTVRCPRAGPVYSSTQPVPPFTVKCPAMARARSLAPTPGLKLPVRRTPTTRGIFR